MKYPFAIRLSLLTCCLALTACDSGAKINKLNSSAESGAQPVATANAAQAIDGYIVDGQVLCDDDVSGLTAAAGWFECPTETTMITVNGGQDVGFDKTATTGGILFTGSLQGPGDARFVTPVTTLATQLAHTDGVFNRADYDDAVSLLQDRLNLKSLDLTGNPAASVELARINVELNLLAQQFSSNTNDYTIVMQAISQVFENNTSVDISDGVAMTSAVNQELTSVAPYLTLSSTTEISIGNALNSELSLIGAAETIEGLESNVEQIQTPAVFALDQDAPLISLVGSDYYFWPGEKIFTLADFMSQGISSSGYEFAITRRDTDKLVFHTDAFTVNETVSEFPTNVALEIESILDSRRLSVVVEGVQVSMVEGDNRSIFLDLPEGTILNAQYVDRNGVITQVTEIAEDDLVASAIDGSFSIDLNQVRNQLSRHGYPDFLRQIGHYRMTAVIDGLKFAITENGVANTPDVYTVSTGTESVSGFGFQGYFEIY